MLCLVSCSARNWIIATAGAADLYITTRANVGAGLLAIAVYQPTDLLNVSQQSRASPLPHFEPRCRLERFNVEDFYVKRQGFTGQRVVEVDGHLRIIEGFDHTRQLGIRRIVKNHQQAFRQVHVLELRTRDDLYVLRVGLAKGVFRQDLKGSFVPTLEANRAASNPGCKLPSPTVKVAGDLSNVLSTVSPFSRRNAKCKVTSVFWPMRCSANT